MKSLKVGVLALQGAFSKHIDMLLSLGVEAIEVRKPQEIAACSGLIIPGGESTTMMKQIDFIAFSDALRQFAEKKPIFGTCAGLILMSQKIIGDPMQPFDLLDIEVERNAFGRQAESFRTEISVSLEKGKRNFFPAIFIRAPRIRKVGKEVKILASYDNEPVLIQQGSHLGATFHPELSHDASIHRHFIRIIQARQQH